ncbi:hypothetical protein JTB14_028566 [Gonioctena quinquepunctata]|nr:hypothetical protein JTB14_028566 [Gonioctena quinquepunctata]
MWMKRIPGKTINIYEIAPLSSQAMVKTLTPATIQAAFKKPGIFLFDKNVFTNAVTDRPDPKSHAETEVTLHLSKRNQLSPRLLKSLKVLINNQKQ